MGQKESYTPCHLNVNLYKTDVRGSLDNDLIVDITCMNMINKSILID